ncbi:MAG TPA: zinc ribbon domain-containing protein [Herpetosiphonaceae bacterium]
MALICPNGHVNDEGNRFCEQCGEPLQESQASAAPSAAQAAPSSGATSSTCPICGQENVPGTAFCDNCGAALPPPLPAATEETAATSAPVEAASTSGATASAATIACPQCGTENDAENRFCDNCGAKITEGDAPAAAEGGPSDAPVDQPELTAPEAPDLAAAPAEAIVLPAPVEAAAPEAGTTADAAAVPAAPEAPVAPAAPDASAERQRLEEVIRTQRQLIGQLEQMQANFGAATPPAILQGLEEARKILAQAESDLQALTGSAPVVPVAPEAPQLQAAAPVEQPAEQPVAQPQQPEAPAPVSAQAAAPSQPAPSQPVAPAMGGTNQLPPSAAQPQASGPRFVTRDGGVLSLPTTGKEIVIGRDDPISGIHPDVDLTPHGGEAGGVSRRHALLREQNGQWLLTDLDSTNYTRVDGNRIAPDTPTPLHDGARVQFGRLEVDFRIG